MAARWAALAAVVLVGTALGGCAEAQHTQQTSPSAASTSPSTLEKATSRDSDLDGEADAGKALTAKQLCGFLAQETPKVVDLQPAEYAAATFGSALFAFYTDQGLLTDIDGQDMDALAAKGCPDAAAELLPALDASTFADLLSR